MAKIKNKQKETITQVKKESCDVCLTASVAQRDVSGPGTPGKCAEDRLNLEETKGSSFQVTNNCVWSSFCSQF